MIIIENTVEDWPKTPPYTHTHIHKSLNAIAEQKQYNLGHGCVTFSFKKGVLEQRDLVTDLIHR